MVDEKGQVIVLHERITPYIKKLIYLHQAT